MTEQSVQERETVALATWGGHLRAMERALAKGDVDAALRAWEQAHLTAVESLRWEGLIAAGEAYLRLGRTARSPHAAEATARRAFFAALYRACRENSFDGVLRAAEAFAALGDGEVVDECLGLAELLADGVEARRRLRAFVARLQPGDPGNPEMPGEGARP